MELFLILSTLFCTALAMLGITVLVHGLALILTVPENKLTTTYIGQLGRTIGCSSLILVPIIFLGGCIWLRGIGAGTSPQWYDPVLLFAVGLLLSGLVGLSIQTIRVMQNTDEYQLPSSTVSPRWDETSASRPPTDEIQPATWDVIIEQLPRQDPVPPERMGPIPRVGLHRVR